MTVTTAPGNDSNDIIRNKEPPIRDLAETETQEVQVKPGDSDPRVEILTPDQNGDRNYRRPIGKTMHEAMSTYY